MKIRKILIIILVILFVLPVFGQSYADDYREVILGFWADMFPVPDQVYGYIFLPDSSYIYFSDRYLDQIKKHYNGSMGKWKIEMGNIYVLSEQEFYWEKDWIYHKSFGWDSGKGNSLFAIKSKDVTWKVIGSIKSIKADRTNPESIVLNNKTYWLLNKNPLADKELKSVIEKRKSLISAL